MLQMVELYHPHFTPLRQRQHTRTQNCSISIYVWNKKRDGKKWFLISKKGSSFIYVAAVYIYRKRWYRIASRPQRYLLFLPAAAESRTALAIVLIIRDYISVTRTVQRYVYIYICTHVLQTLLHIYFMFYM
jgi:UDP-N-acetylglucosamine:LPS N-acetylglucosamine transferase